MPSLSTLLTVLAVMLCFSAFFSASEAALISLNKVRLRHWMAEKRHGSQRIWRMVTRLDKVIATILVGNNLVNTGIAAIITVLFARLFGGEEGGITVAVATVVTTVVLVIFGDLIPKVIATNHPERIAFLFRHLIEFFILAFSPLAWFLTWVGNGIIRILGGNPHHRSPLVTEEEIKMMITIGKEEGFYGDNERRMLERIFHFDEIEVRDVMTPLDKVVSVPIDVEPEELERVLMEEGHNRIPVYQGTEDNIIGVLYVRDLLYLFKSGSLIRIEDLLNAPFYVAHNKRVAELLKEFQSRKLQIAIVRDSRTNKITGLVTLEDLLEEIVGEIEEIDSKLMK